MADHCWHKKDDGEVCCFCNATRKKATQKPVGHGPYYPGGWEAWEYAASPQQYTYRELDPGTGICHAVAATVDPFVCPKRG